MYTYKMTEEQIHKMTKEQIMESLHPHGMVNLLEVRRPNGSVMYQASLDFRQDFSKGFKPPLIVWSAVSPEGALQKLAALFYGHDWETKI